MKKKTSKLRIEFPDVSAKEQIKMAKDWKSVFKAFEKLTGESSGNAIPEMDKLIKKLESNPSKT